MNQNRIQIPTLTLMLVLLMCFPGWLSAVQSIEIGGTAIITGDNLSFRTQPNLESRVIRYLSKGTRVTVISKAESIVEVGDMRDYFYLVRLQSGSRGYVYGHYLEMVESAPEPAPSPRPVTTVDPLDSNSYARCTGQNVNYRYGPGTNRRVLGQLDRNQQVKVLARSSNQTTLGGYRAHWYRVQMSNGRIGWVWGRYLNECDRGNFEIQRPQSPSRASARERGYLWSGVLDFLPLEDGLYWKWSEPPFVVEEYITKRWTEGGNNGWETLQVKKRGDQVYSATIERYITTDLRLVGTRYIMTDNGEIQSYSYTPLQIPFEKGRTWTYQPGVEAKIKEVHLDVEINGKTYSDCMVLALYQEDLRSGNINRQNIEPGWFCTYQYWQPHTGIIAEKKVRANERSEIPEHNEIPYHTRSLIEFYSTQNIVEGEWYFQHPAGYDYGLFQYTFKANGDVDIVYQGTNERQSREDRITASYLIESNIVQISIDDPDFRRLEMAAILPNRQEWELRLFRDRFRMVSLQGSVLTKHD